MGSSLKELAGLIFAVILLIVVVFSIGASVYGIYLAFSASILMGVLTLVLEPAPLIIGATMLIADVNLAEQTMNYIGSL